MSKEDEVLKDIEAIREDLLYLINIKLGNLLDDEVVLSSNILNSALNEYNKFNETKLKRYYP